MDTQDELLEVIPEVYTEGHALFLCLQFSSGKLRKEGVLDAIYELDDILREVVEATDAGVYDGHECYEAEDEESVTFFIYGPDVDLIQESIEPVLNALPLLPGSFILKRYGNFGAYEEQIFLM